MLARIRKSKETEGFTLIELLVVIIIIGILAAIAIPVFLNQRKKGYDSALKSDLRNLAVAEETYLTDNNVYTSDLTLVEFKKSPDSNYDAAALVPVVTLYNADGTAATGTTANGSWCALSVSASGKSFIYNSSKGGLSEAAACPGTNA